MAEVIEVRTEEFRREAGKLLGVDNKQIVLGMRRELRTASKPAGDRILGAIADRLPKRGGLADLVRNRGRVSVLLDLRRGVRIQLSNKARVWMGPFEAGYVRHPVFGRWLPGQPPQQVLSAGAGAAQFEQEADGLARQVAESVHRAVGRIV